MHKPHGMWQGWNMLVHAIGAAMHMALDQQICEPSAQLDSWESMEFHMFYLHIYSMQEFALYSV